MPAESPGVPAGVPVLDGTGRIRRGGGLPLLLRPHEVELNEDGTGPSGPSSHGREDVSRRHRSPPGSDGEQRGTCRLPRDGWSSRSKRPIGDASRASRIRIGGGKQQLPRMAPGEDGGSH